MDVASKITQKLAVLLVITGAVVANEFADGGFVRAQSGSLPELSTGVAAPDFSLPNAKGKQVKLSDYKGKLVVLEWFNMGCPFVQKHYDSGNMQGLQKTYTEKGVVWLSICSSAKGKQGYAEGAEHLKAMADKGGKPTDILIDADGKVGRMFGAKTTPHMFVVDKAGKLAYAGAIDDKRSTDAEDVKTSKNYVKAALDELLKGKTPTVASTQAYGCSVKYQ